MLWWHGDVFCHQHKHLTWLIVLHSVGLVRRPFRSGPSDDSSCLVSCKTTVVRFFSTYKSLSWAMGPTTLRLHQPLLIMCLVLEVLCLCFLDKDYKIFYRENCTLDLKVLCLCFNQNKSNPLSIQFRSINP